MGLSGIAKGALILIGAGILAERFGAGRGLTGLGAGVTSIVSAPGVGVGLGLTGTAGGIRDIAESIGDIGRGFGELFENIPKVPGYKGPVPGIPDPWVGPYLPSPDPGPYPPPVQMPPLVPKGGGGGTDNLPGGGGNVPLGPGVYRVGVAGNGYTFPGGKTIWRTEEAALKNYRTAQGSSQEGWLNV